MPYPNFFGLFGEASTTKRIIINLLLQADCLRRLYPLGVVVESRQENFLGFDG